MSSFGEVISSFKKNDEPENIVAIVNDEKLQNCMIAWKSVQIQYLPASDCDHKDPVAQWNWLWDQIRYDAEKFGIVAGIRLQDVGATLSRLKGYHLIYPDGTIDRFAKQYLQAIIMSKLRNIGPKSQPPRKETIQNKPESDIKPSIEVKNKEE